MGEVEIRRLQVAFNIRDPDQKKLYEHAAQRSNVSAYLKRLIQRDMEGGIVPLRQVPKCEQPPVELDRGLMRGLI